MIWDVGGIGWTIPTKRYFAQDWAAVSLISKYSHRGAEP